MMSMQLSRLILPVILPFVVAGVCTIRAKGSTGADVAVSSPEFAPEAADGACV